jgi:hypothetical protein
MAGSSLFALLDDIATLLDDVAILTKVAAKKSAGVLGDDLALNAEQVSGIRAERELPVVWAVAKGSFVNKLILVPAALAISYFAPFLVIPLLMIGGAFLCFEGVEKVLHKLLHSKKEDDQHHAEQLKAIADEQVDMVKFEQDKIKGAIRTDFILSAEIIVIALGTVAAKNMTTQALVLSAIAVAMTIGVYGLVAGIVKLDDLGLHLDKKSGMLKKLGRGILWFAPKIMKFLSIAGTAAMFLVGGAIVVHGIPMLHHLIEGASGVASTTPQVGWLFGPISTMLMEALVGVLVGAIVLAAVLLGKKLFIRSKSSAPA